MEFDWSEEKDGFPADKLDRAKYAEFLTDYLSSRKDESYVMNLNAEWGAGKTYFLKRWHNEIKYRYPSAYIDAWKNDFSEDPLLTVISEILLALENYSKKYPNTKVLKYRKKAIEKSGQFLKSATKEMLKHQFKKHAGEEAFDMISLGIEGVSGNITQGIIESHRNKRKLIDEFKNEIKSWIDNLVSESNNKILLPMYVYIDELDRCRPTYAIELLETVKHIFDIEGIVFVVATNTNQLQHSIKAVYGESFDCSRYLYRFFERSFALKKPKLEEFIRSQLIYQNSLLPALQSTCEGNLICTEGEVIENLSSIATSFNFDLRTTNQWLDRIWASLNSKDKRDKYIWIYLAILSALKITKAELFNELFSARNSINKISSEKKREWIRKYSDLFNDIEKEKLTASIKNKLAEKFINNNNAKKLSRETYFCEIKISIDYLCTMSQLLNVVDPRDLAGKWDVNDIKSVPDKERLTYMLFQDRKENLGVKKENYLDLIEMASDLT